MAPSALVREGRCTPRLVACAVAFMVLASSARDARKAMAEPAPQEKPASTADQRAAASPPGTQTPRSGAGQGDKAGASAGSRAEARRLSDAFVAVAEKVSPSVVQVEVAVRDQSSAVLRWYRGTPFMTEPPVRRGMGSGVVVSPDGAILTNNHVLEDALSVTIRLHDGRILPAQIVGRDPATDLAVVRVQAKGLAVAQLADSSIARVGEWVVAIGSPFGLGYTVTTGVLSAKGRGGVGINSVEDYLQTDASINPGNSGGPLVNLDGQVLGINTMIIGKGQGIGFAVPSNLARRTVDQILRMGHVERAWIGVSVQDVTPEIAAELKSEPGSGALVNNVAADSPGSRAHLRPGDVITAVDGRRVHEGQELVRELLSRDVGTSVQLEVIRGGHHYGARVDLLAQPAAAASAPRAAAPNNSQGLGLGLRDLAAAAAQTPGGRPSPIAQIVEVTPGTAADRAGLRPGDIIIEVDGVALPSSTQVMQAARAGHLLLRIRRQDAVFYTALHR